MSGSDDLTLGQLLDRAISTAFKVSAAPTANDKHVQNELQAALSDLTLCASLITHLGVLSPNETLDDINTRDLRCILVDGLRGEMTLLLKTTSGKERIANLEKATEQFRKYIELVDRYEVVPEGQRAIFAGPQHATQDPAKRRASKIAQFKMEREIKGTLDELRARRRLRRPRPPTVLSSPASSTPSSSTSAPPPPPSDSAPEDDLDFDSDDDDADVARPLFINLLLLHYLRAHSELASTDMELEMLRSSIAMSDLPNERFTEVREDGGREERREGEEDGTWRVDRIDKGKSGPLLDKEGKVMRPFTILPAAASQSTMNTRLRFQSEVFRESHRLPTMTIDEFLQQEEDQGRILQGGGPSTSEEVDQARRDEQAAKENDTTRGYEEEERELLKLREQDEYRDTHRKGEGNMYNRG